MSYFREQLEDYLSKLTVKCDVVYDFGGSQKPVQDRVNYWKVKDYKIYDLPEYDLNRRWAIEDVRPKCDIAFCLEVMEYIWNPLIALRNIHEAINDKGILIISFPFIYPHHNPEGMDCLRYTKWGAVTLLKKAGFEIDEVESRYATRGSGALQDFFSFEGMKRCKTYDGHNEIGYMIKARKK